MVGISVLKQNAWHLFNHQGCLSQPTCSSKKIITLLVKRVTSVQSSASDLLVATSLIVEDRTLLVKRVTFCRKRVTSTSKKRTDCRWEKMWQKISLPKPNLIRILTRNAWHLFNISASGLLVVTNFGHRPGALAWHHYSSPNAVLAPWNCLQNWPKAEPLRDRIPRNPSKSTFFDDFRKGVPFRFVILGSRFGITLTKVFEYDKHFDYPKHVHFGGSQLHWVSPMPASIKPFRYNFFTKFCIELDLIHLMS